MVKLGDFYIGTIELFSTLLPGAIITYCIGPGINSTLCGCENIKLLNKASDLEKVGVFLITSYIAGHIIFLIGSYLDKHAYDKINCLFSKNKNQSLEGAIYIKKKYFEPFKENKDQNSKAEDTAKPDKLSEEMIASTFNWAQHLLLLKCPECLTKVERLQADSKFFRSLVVIFIILGIDSIIKCNSIWGLIYLLLLVLSFIRYCELRYKSTVTAYEQVITFYTTSKDNNNLEQSDAKQAMKD